MSKTKKETYLKIFHRTLQEISVTPKDNPARFNVLKRKLEKIANKIKNITFKS